MAVLVEGISVIVRAEALETRYVGGWERFRENVPNQTLCADGELVRVGFMSPQDVQSFVEDLESGGFTFQLDGKAVDIVVADQQRGITLPCEWALFGRIDWQGNPDKKIAACMLKGSDLKQVLTPDGWTYEGSLSESFGFIENDAIDTANRVAMIDGLEVWTSPLSDELQYIGRTHAPSRDPAKQPRPKKRGWLNKIWGRS